MVWKKKNKNQCCWWFDAIYEIKVGHVGVIIHTDKTKSTNVLHNYNFSIKKKLFWFKKKKTKTILKAKKYKKKEYFQYPHFLKCYGIGNLDHRHTNGLIGSIIKKENADDDDERLSPSSTGSFTSGASVTPTSVQIANIVRQHHQQQTELQRQQHQQQQLHHNQQQQQQQQHFDDQQRTFNAQKSAEQSSSALANDFKDLIPTNVPPGYLLPCPLCNVPLEPRIFRQHLDRHYPRDSPVCPVLQCGRRFAHPNSVRNHMRIKHTLQWAKMKAMRSSGGPFNGMADFKWNKHEENWINKKNFYFVNYFRCSKTNFIGGSRESAKKSKRNVIEIKTTKKKKIY